MVVMAAAAALPAVMSTMVTCFSMQLSAISTHHRTSKPTPIRVGVSQAELSEKSHSESV